MEKQACLLIDPTRDEILDWEEKRLFSRPERNDESRQALTFDFFESTWAWIVNGAEIFANLERQTFVIPPVSSRRRSTNQFSFEKCLLFSFAGTLSSVRCQKEMSQLLQIVRSSLFPVTLVVVLVVGHLRH